MVKSYPPAGHAAAWLDPRVPYPQGQAPRGKGMEGCLLRPKGDGSPPHSWMCRLASRLWYAGGAISPHQELLLAESQPLNAMSKTTPASSVTTAQRLEVGAALDDELPSSTKGLLLSGRQRAL